jgi:hypothetical protein
METDELQRYIRLFNGKSNQEKYGATTTKLRMYKIIKKNL